MNDETPPIFIFMKVSFFKQTFNNFDEANKSQICGNQIC
jgi:hypothetical protein